MRGHGRLRVTRGDNAAARVLAWILRLPRAGDAVETELVVSPCAGGTRWRRTFHDQPLDSRQYPTADGGVAERFGVLELRFRLDDDGCRSQYCQTGAALVAGRFRIPLPRACAPAITAREDHADPRRRHVDVQVQIPLVGRLLAYEGTIEVDEAAAW